MLLGAERVVATADVAGAMSLEALRGTPDAFDPRIQRARPHPGQVASGRAPARLLEGSEIRECHRHDDPRVQDAYALRCMPQVHGAARDALASSAACSRSESNTRDRQPARVPDEPEGYQVLSGGNFHGQPSPMALDLLAIAITDLATISERRIDRLVNPDLNELPASSPASRGCTRGS